MPDILPAFSTAAHGNGNMGDIGSTSWYFGRVIVELLNFCPQTDKDRPE